MLIIFKIKTPPGVAAPNGEPKEILLSFGIEQSEPTPTTVKGANFVYYSSFFRRMQAFLKGVAIFLWQQSKKEESHTG